MEFAYKTLWAADHWQIFPNVLLRKIKLITLSFIKKWKWMAFFVPRNHYLMCISRILHVQIYSLCGKDAEQAVNIK